MINLENQNKEELVEAIKESMNGLHMAIAIRNQDYVRVGIAVGLGSAVGTGAFLGARQLVRFAKQKLRERKIEQENSKED